MIWIGLGVLAVITLFVAISLFAGFMVMIKAIGDVDREDFE
jgi:ABC-type nitrate/sulfonate/bicarbonate transport system permease component